MSAKKLLEQIESYEKILDSYLQPNDDLIKKWSNWLSEVMQEEVEQKLGLSEFLQVIGANNALNEVAAADINAFSNIKRDLQRLNNETAEILMQPLESVPPRFFTLLQSPLQNLKKNIHTAMILTQGLAGFDEAQNGLVSLLAQLDNELSPFTSKEINGAEFSTWRANYFASLSENNLTL